MGFKRFKEFFYKYVFWTHNKLLETLISRKSFLTSASYLKIRAENTIFVFCLGFDPPLILFILSCLSYYTIALY